MLVDGEWRQVGTARRRRRGGRPEAEGVAASLPGTAPAHRADVNGPEGQSSFALRTGDDLDQRGGVAGECRAPLPGAVTKVLVAEGDAVAEGEGLVVLEAMKMEHTLRANGAGTVARFTARPASRSTCTTCWSRGAGMTTAPDAGHPADRELQRVLRRPRLAAREMVEGGPIDVLTGDWLAELTMYILHKTRQRSGGYARTFLRELEEVLPTCIERGITVVSNAGGLQPGGSGGRGAGVGPAPGPRRARGLGLGRRHHAAAGGAAGSRGRSSSTSIRARPFPPTRRS